MVIFGLEVLDGRAANAGFLQLIQPPSHGFLPATHGFSWEAMWCLRCTPGDVVAGVRDQLPEINLPLIWWDPC